MMSSSPDAGGLAAGRRRGRPGPGRVGGRVGARPPARGLGGRRGPGAPGGLPLWGASRRDPAPLGNPVAWFRTSFLDDDDMSFADPQVRDSLLETDAGLNLTLLSSGTSVAQFFSQDMWERHRSIDRYTRNMSSFTKSTVLKRCMKICLYLTGWATAVTAVCLHLPALAISIQPVPLILLGPSIGLLLVLRTNASYARFAEARHAFGKLTGDCKNLARMLVTGLATTAGGAGGDDDGAAMRRGLGLVKAVCYSTKSRMRAGRTRKDPSDPTVFRDDPTEVYLETLGRRRTEFVLAQANQPLCILQLLTGYLQGLVDRRRLPEPYFTQIDDSIAAVNGCLGVMDKIVSTPMPLSYTRHTTRSLLVYLFAIPFALWPSAGWLTPVILFFISIILLGIEECGVQIEEPFAILPLTPLCESLAVDLEMLRAAAGVGVGGDGWGEGWGEEGEGGGSNGTVGRAAGGGEAA